jgi:hypothetical protein
LQNGGKELVSRYPVFDLETPEVEVVFFVEVAFFVESGCFGGRGWLVGW